MERKRQRGTVREEKKERRDGGEETGGKYRGKRQQGRDSAVV
jgi:hypothetical protein